jgi:hypothetical protein
LVGSILKTEGNNRYSNQEVEIFTEDWSGSGGHPLLLEQK